MVKRGKKGRKVRMWGQDVDNILSLSVCVCVCVQVCMLIYRPGYMYTESPVWNQRMWTFFYLYQCQACPVGLPLWEDTEPPRLSQRKKKIAFRYCLWCGRSQWSVDKMIFLWNLPSWIKKKIWTQLRDILSLNGIAHGLYSHSINAVFNLPILKVEIVPWLHLSFMHLCRKGR